MTNYMGPAEALMEWPLVVLAVALVLSAGIIIAFVREMWD